MSQKATNGGQKGAKTDPRSDQNLSQNRFGRQGRFWERKWRARPTDFGSFLVHFWSNLALTNDEKTLFFVYFRDFGHPKIHPKIDSKKGCQKTGPPRKNVNFSTRRWCQKTPPFARPPSEGTSEGHLQKNSSER